MSPLHASTPVAPARLAPALRRRAALLLALLGAGGASGAAMHALADGGAAPTGAAAAADAPAHPGTRLGVTVRTAEWRELAICEAGPCPAPTDATAQPRRERVHRARTIALFWSSAP